MLAINRILKVEGRIRVLTNSIITIKLIKGEGVLRGTKWANILLEYVYQPYIKKPDHRGIENIKLKVMCLDGVNTFGRRPNILQNIKNKKIVQKIKLDPSFFDFKAIINCFFNIFTNFLKKRDTRLGIFQKE